MTETTARSERRKRMMHITREEIKDAAWAQIRENGASALSLRAVASSIGFSAPALYRYFPSKKDLVTALVNDAFSSLALRMDACLEHADTRDWKTQLRRLGQAYRAWALEQPSAFLLIFGNPIDDYETPWDQTMHTAGSSLRALILTIETGRSCGDVHIPLLVPASPELYASLETWSNRIHHVHPDVLYLAFVVATRVQGLMIAEIGRQLPPCFPDGKALYAREIERIILELQAC